VKALAHKKNRQSRHKAKVKVRHLIILIVLTGAGIFLSVAIHKAACRLFPVREIVFSGNRHISDAELKSLAGIPSGEGLLGISSKGIAQRLSQCAWIRSASVRKEFPDKILVRVCESTPFAILDKRGQTFLIDERGAILEKITGDAVPFLPIIIADPIKMRDTFAEALRLAGVLKDKKIATERGRVEVVANGKGPEDLAVIIDGVVIKVGQGDYEQKLDRLFSLEDEIKKRAITVDYVDLRFANRVVVKPISQVVR
jgi:cell division protein FtsQ